MMSLTEITGAVVITSSSKLTRALSVTSSAAMMDLLFKSFKLWKFCGNILCFFVLRYRKCDITVTGKAVNFGDGDGMKVPCLYSKLIRANVCVRDTEKQQKL